MIPTMILLGLILGRWWWLALGVASIGWPLILLTTNVVGFDYDLIAGAVLAAANAGVGVLAHQVGLHAYRQARRRKPPVVSG